MSFNFSPKIVTNGLVFSFDPANRKSFVSGSTTANGLVGADTYLFKKKVYGGGIGDVVTIISPTFYEENKGVIFFNGTTVLSGEALYLSTGDTTTNLNTFVSASFWFKKNSYNYSYVECPVSKGFNTPLGGSQTFSFFLLGSTIYARTTTNTYNGYSDISTTYDINKWTNAVLTYDGSYLKLYLNGVLKNSTPKSGPLMNSSNPFNIGCQNNGGYFPSTAPSKTSEYFNGYISNVMIYNKGLTQQEVLQNYNALKPRFGL